MILSKLTLFLKAAKTRPKKSLSQNFLIDPNVIRKIIQTAEIQPEDVVLEIGAGPGNLTRALLENGAKVYAVEIDPVFAKELTRWKSENLRIFHADFLKFPMELFPSNFKVVANLPYHITAPILSKVFAHPFSHLTLMVQKEVAARMIAQAGSKNFGPLSLFVQFYSKFQTTFPVSAHCFYPKPKVDSSVIRLTAKEPPKVDPALFFPLIRKAFQQRRKKITTSLHLPKDRIRTALCSLSASPDARPEELSLETWVELTKELTDLLLEEKKERPFHLSQSN